MVLQVAIRSQHIFKAFGKRVSLEVLRSETLPLSKVGYLTVSVDETLATSIRRVNIHRECSSLTDCGQKLVWRKVTRNIVAASMPQSLPPTRESFMGNVPGHP